GRGGAASGTGRGRGGGAGVGPSRRGVAGADPCVRPAARLKGSRPVMSRQIPLIFSIRAHSASVTGITDKREIRTSGKVANALSALISFSVTGRASFFTGATSTTDALPLLSAGSGYASDSAVAIATTDFSSPVW